MEQLCKLIKEREEKLYSLYSFFTLEEIRTSSLNDMCRAHIKDLAHMYKELDDMIYSHYSTK